MSESTKAAAELPPGAPSLQHGSPLTDFIARLFSYPSANGKSVVSTMAQKSVPNQWQFSLLPRFFISIKKNIILISL